MLHFVASTTFIFFLGGGSGGGLHLNLFWLTTAAAGRAWESPSP